jgi:hypothetical protein
MSTYFSLSRTVLSCSGNVVFSSCICDENGAAMKQLDAGAVTGWSAAGPAFVMYAAGRTTASVASRTTGQFVAVTDEAC